MPCATPCPNCARTGLPILFTRYAAAYSAQAEGMAALERLPPTGNLQAKPGGVTIQTARYNLRMLRPGYLYVRIKRVGLTREWMGYAVHPHGYLSEFPVALPAEARSNPACEVEIRGATKSLVWVPDAKRVESLHYLFHPDPIDYQHLMDVIEPNPGKYAQRFDVAGWFNGNTSQPDTAQPSQLDGQVVEFAALLDKKVESVGSEQYHGLMGRTPQEREWGHYEDVKVGRRFGETAGGAAVGPAVGPHTETVLQLPYASAHGPRLKKIAELLQEKRGAVVACEDAIGIAQEISMHHLTAAIPYVAWLKETDGKGISNQWKQAASESVRTLRLALARKAVAAYDDNTDRLDNAKDVLSSGYPGSDSHQPIKLRRADGSYEEVSVTELNRRRVADLEQRIGARESDRSVLASQAASADALARVTQYCDMSAIAAFDALHKDELDRRDGLMDRIAVDLQAWLKADAFIEKALGRYNDKASIESGDGARCAGQLCAILLQIDSAPKGRQWYAALDLFTPDTKNLVWRMLSLNNTEISTELEAALAQFKTPLSPAGLEVRDAEEKALHEKSYATMVAALGQISKTLSASDKINSGLPKVLDSGLKRLERLQATGELARVVYDSPHAVLGAAAMARFKALPIVRGESVIAKAQLMLMARGLGQQAVAFTRKQQADALTRAASKQARHTQRLMEKAIQTQLAEAAGKDMRLSNVLLSLNALAILPALARANTKRDERSTTELLSTMAGLMGSMRQWRSDLYEKALFKQLPDMVYKTHKAGTTMATEAELMRMKSGAAHFVVAGAIVGVAWDAADAVTAFRQEENKLGIAYTVRAISGGFAIGGVIAGAQYVKAPLWLVRFNFVTTIAATALTVAIGKLKGEAWANWLQAQPFSAALIRLKDAPLVEVEHRKVRAAGVNHKLIYKSEREMVDKLSDALAEID